MSSSKRIPSTPPGIPTIELYTKELFHKMMHLLTCLDEKDFETARDRHIDILTLMTITPKHAEALFADYNIIVRDHVHQYPFENLFLSQLRKAEDYLSALIKFCEGKEALQDVLQSATTNLTYKVKKRLNQLMSTPAPQNSSSSTEAIISIPATVVSQEQKDVLANKKQKIRDLENDLRNIHYPNKEWKKSLEKYQEAHKLREELKLTDDASIRAQINNIHSTGICHAMLGDEPKLSIACYDAALKLATSIQAIESSLDKTWLSLLMLDYSSSYLCLLNYPVAQRYFDRALEYKKVANTLEKINERIINLANICREKYTTAKETNDYKSAKLITQLEINIRTHFYKSNKSDQANADQLFQCRTNSAAIEYHLTAGNPQGAKILFQRYTESFKFLRKNKILISTDISQVTELIISRFDALNFKEMPHDELELLEQLCTEIISQEEFKKKIRQQATKIRHIITAVFGAVEAQKKRKFAETIQHISNAIYQVEQSIQHQEQALQQFSAAQEPKPAPSGSSIAVELSEVRLQFQQTTAAFNALISGSSNVLSDFSKTLEELTAINTKLEPITNTMTVLLLQKRSAELSLKIMDGNITVRSLLENEEKNTTHHIDAHRSKALAQLQLDLSQCQQALNAIDYTLSTELQEKLLAVEIRIQTIARQSFVIAKKQFSDQFNVATSLTSSLAVQISALEKVPSNAEFLALQTLFQQRSKELTWCYIDSQEELFSQEKKLQEILSDLKQIEKTCAENLDLFILKPLKQVSEHYLELFNSLSQIKPESRSAFMKKKMKSLALHGEKSKKLAETLHSLVSNHQDIRWNHLAILLNEANENLSALKDIQSTILQSQLSIAAGDGRPSQSSLAPANMTSPPKSNGPPPSTGNTPIIEIPQNATQLDPTNELDLLPGFLRTDSIESPEKHLVTPVALVAPTVSWSYFSRPFFFPPASIVQNTSVTTNNNTQPQQYSSHSGRTSAPPGLSK